jgi:hypothetical protein
VAIGGCDGGGGGGRVFVRDGGGGGGADLVWHWKLLRGADRAGTGGGPTGGCGVWG